MACLAYMRDSLVTALAAVLVHSDRLKSWQVANLYCTVFVLHCTVSRQVAKLPRCEAQGWFSRLFSSYAAAGQRAQ